MSVLVSVLLLNGRLLVPSEAVAVAVAAVAAVAAAAALVLAPAVLFHAPVGVARSCSAPCC